MHQSAFVVASASGLIEIFTALNRRYQAAVKEADGASKQPADL